MGSLVLGALEQDPLGRAMKEKRERGHWTRAGAQVAPRCEMDREISIAQGGGGDSYHEGLRVITGQDIKMPLWDTGIGGLCPLGLSWEMQGVSPVLSTPCVP